MRAPRLPTQFPPTSTSRATCLGSKMALLGRPHRRLLSATGHAGASSGEILGTPLFPNSAFPDARSASRRAASSICRTLSRARTIPPCRPTGPAIGDLKDVFGFSSFPAGFPSRRVAAILAPRPQEAAAGRKRGNAWTRSNMSGHLPRNGPPAARWRRGGGCWIRASA